MLARKKNKSNMHPLLMGLQTCTEISVLGPQEVEH